MNSIKIRSLSIRRLFLCLFLISVLLVSAGVSFAAGSGTKAYAVEAANNILLSFTTNSPGALTSEANLAGTTITGADFLTNDFSNLYLLDSANNSLYGFDTGTATITLISDTEISGTTMPETGETWSGLTGDATTLYASSTNCTDSSTLYTISTSTGVATVVGAIASNCIQDIAIDSAGNLYGIDTSTDSLVSIDPSDGLITATVAIDYDAENELGMDFDETSGTPVLYLTTYNNDSGNDELRIIDTTTGTTTWVGDFPVGTFLDALAFTSETVYTEVTVIFPNGGEILPAGYYIDSIEWGAPPEAVSFKIQYSCDYGNKWKKVAKFLTELTELKYLWLTKIPKKDLTDCLVQVIGYDATKQEIGRDTSDAIFTIATSLLLTPEAGITVFEGGSVNITWETYATKARVDKVKINYSIDGGQTWISGGEVQGNPEEFLWTVPGLPAGTYDQARVQIVLKDKRDNKIGLSTSGLFTIIAF